MTWWATILLLSFSISLAVSKARFSTARPFLDWWMEMTVVFRVIRPFRYVFTSRALHLKLRLSFSNWLLPQQTLDVMNNPLQMFCFVVWCYCIKSCSLCSLSLCVFFSLYDSGAQSHGSFPAKLEWRFLCSLQWAAGQQQEAGRTIKSWNERNRRRIWEIVEDIGWEIQRTIDGAGW